MKKIAIIPAYNEEGSILKTVKDLRENAPDFDYIIINDCSTDDTQRICESHNLHVVNLPVNLGIGGGVQTGDGAGLLQGLAHRGGAAHTVRCSLTVTDSTMPSSLMRWRTSSSRKTSTW